MAFIGSIGVGHQATTHTDLRIQRRVSGLENTQAQLGIFCDAPLSPPANLVHGLAANHAHRAVLDDRVVLIALNHPNTKEAIVFLVQQPLEQAFVGIAVILWGLHDANFFVGKTRQHSLQPIRVDLIIAIDHANECRRRVSQFKRLVQCASLEALHVLEMIEAELRA